MAPDGPPRPDRYRIVGRCPNCGEGDVAPLTCPSCEKLMFACNEAGCLFRRFPGADLEGWPCDVWTSTYTRCPHCRVEVGMHFSSDEEIEAHGLDLTELGWWPPEDADRSGTP